MILDEIVNYKRKKIKREKEVRPLNIILDQLEIAPKSKDFKAIIKSNSKISIIGEIKKASPSKGVIRKAFDPVKIANDYEACHIDAMSVLTEEDFFMGSDKYLQDVRKTTKRPILRKDFIIDAYQIYQSKILGADIVLLIAGILSKKELVQFQNICKEIDLQCLIEVHDQKELNVVLDTESEIIGINNRDLNTFETNLKTTEILRAGIPNEKLIISESGIFTRADLLFLENLNIDGALIGESLMKSDSVKVQLELLRG